MKRVWKILLAAVFGGGLTLGCLKLTYDEMNAEDKTVAWDCVAFRCEVGRWPVNSADLIQKATPSYRPVIEGELKHLRVHFANNNEDLRGRAIKLQFKGWMGLGLVDDWALSLDEIPCSMTRSTFKRFVE